MTQEERDQAIDFLQKTPSQRARTLTKKDETSILLVLRARCVGILSGSVLHFATEFECTPGEPCRPTAADAVRKLDRLELSISVEELFTGVVTCENILDYDESDWRQQTLSVQRIREKSIENPELETGVPISAVTPEIERTIQ